MKKVKRFSGYFVIALAIVSFTFAGTARAKNLIVATGLVGGSWFSQMVGMGTFIEKYHPDIVFKTVPGSTYANPVRVHENEAQLAWGMGFVSRQAFNGEDRFQKRYDNVRGIASGFAVYPWQIFTTRSSGINTMPDIKNKKIGVNLATTTAGHIEEWATRTVLEYYGITYDDIKKWGGRIMFLDLADQATKVKDGQANLLFTMMPNPMPIIQEILLTKSLKSIPQDPGLLKMVLEKYDCPSTKITRGSYSQEVVDEEFMTVALNCVLLVNKDVEDDIVYRITKTLCENEAQLKATDSRYKDFEPAEAWESLGVPVHPGAEKYYREKGYLK